ncbi:hypothetical protein OAO01_00185 [Oligoflexia bacterium]|nr:hypothetical protein [Oligoflexia bacterium]
MEKTGGSDGLFREHDEVMIESLGVGEDFRKFRSSLGRKYELRMIKVSTDLDLCFTRVQTRDTENHIQVSDDKVREYNRIAAKVELPWCAQIDNNGPASEAEILGLFNNRSRGLNVLRLLLVKGLNIATSL